MSVLIVHVEPGDKLLLTIHGNIIHEKVRADFSDAMQYLSDVLGIPVVFVDGVSGVAIAKGADKGAEHDPEPPSYYDLAKEYGMLAPVGFPSKEERGLMTSAEYAKSAPVNAICRRCYRKPGDTARPPCGDCADFAEQPAEVDNI